MWISTKKFQILSICYLLMKANCNIQLMDFHFINGILCLQEISLKLELWQPKDLVIQNYKYNIWKMPKIKISLQLIQELKPQFSLLKEEWIIWYLEVKRISIFLVLLFSFQENKHLLTIFKGKMNRLLFIAVGGLVNISRFWLKLPFKCFLILKKSKKIAKKKLLLVIFWIDQDFLSSLTSWTGLNRSIKAIHRTNTSKQSLSEQVLQDCTQHID